VFHTCLWWSYFWHGSR